MEVVVTYVVGKQLSSIDALHTGTPAGDGGPGGVGHLDFLEVIVTYLAGEQQGGRDALRTEHSNGVGGGAAIREAGKGVLQGGLIADMAGDDTNR